MKTCSITEPGRRRRGHELGAPDREADEVEKFDRRAAKEQEIQNEVNVTSHVRLRNCECQSCFTSCQAHHLDGGSAVSYRESQHKAYRPNGSLGESHGIEASPSAHVSR